MQPINMLKMHYSTPNYSINRQNSQPLHNIPSFKAIEDDKYKVKMEVESHQNKISKFLSKIGLTKPKKTEIISTPDVDKTLVTDEQFDILSEAFSDSGKIKSIKKENIGNLCTYGKITLASGFTTFLPNKENILPKEDLKQKIIKEASEMLSLTAIQYTLKAMESLYDTDIDDMTEVIEKQPDEPVILDESEFNTSPEDKDNYLKNGLKRKDVTALLRFGEHSLVNGKRLPHTQNAEWQIRIKINKDAKLSDLRIINNDYNEKIIYYDQNTNLTTIFNAKGEPQAQVAFNTYYTNREDDIPTDYKLYSLYDKTKGKFIKFNDEN